MPRTLPAGRRLLACAVVAASVSGSAPTAEAQTAPPNQAGVAMGHLHYVVRDVGASRAFWLSLGGRALGSDGQGAEAIEFPDVVVRLLRGEPVGGSDGAVVNHVAFRVPSFAQVEAVGLRVSRVAAFPGVGSVMSPDGERIELFEDAATNLAFVPDVGTAEGIVARHLRPVGRPIAFHHIHLYLPAADAVPLAKAWYVKHFGGVPGKRSTYDAVDLPGVNLNFSAAPKPPVAPTKGRTLDHLSFEVRDMDAVCAGLQKDGVSVVRVPARPGRAATAELTDPWGTAIELTERTARF